jgi:hypothetical protein
LDADAVQAAACRRTAAALAVATRKNDKVRAALERRTQVRSLRATILDWITQTLTRDGTVVATWARRPAAMGQARIYGLRLIDGTRITAALWRVARPDRVGVAWVALPPGQRFSEVAALGEIARRIADRYVADRAIVVMPASPPGEGLSVTAALLTVACGVEGAAQRGPRRCGYDAPGGALSGAAARAVRQAVAAGHLAVPCLALDGRIG